MLRTIWLKTLRDYRFAILIWGIGLGILVLYTMVAIKYLGTSTSELAQSFKFFGEPIAIDTPAGYATWDTINIIPVFLGIWMVIAGARIGRGEEDRHSSDITYVLPLGRLRIALEKVGALGTALIAIALLITVFTLWGQSLSDTPVDFNAALLTSLNAILASFVFAMMAFAIAQIVPRAATASGIAGTILGFAYIIEGTGFVIDNGEWLQRFSPLYYFELSKPLITSYGANAGAIIVQMILAVFFLSIGIFWFLRRNIDDVTFSIHRVLPTITTESRSPERLVTPLQDFYTRTEGLRAFRANFQPLCWWLLVMMIYVGWMVALAHTTHDSLIKMLNSSPTFSKVLELGESLSETTFVSTLIFLYLPVGLVLFALFQTLGWPGDLDNQRLEIPLTSPQARTRLYWERVASVAVGLVAMPIACGIATAIAAYMSGMRLDTSKLVPSFIGLLPQEFIIVGVVFALSTWLRPNVISGLVGTLLCISFFAEFLNPIAKFPEWVLSLSIFHQYGKPYTNSPNWEGWLVLVLLTGIFLGIGSFRFRQNDIRM
jgi:ABC-2 type transport system permease protein